MIAVLAYLLSLYLLIVIVTCVLSFFPIAPEGFMGQVQRVLRGLTEPLLRPIRRVLGPVRIGQSAVDLSPLVLIVGIYIAQGLLARLA